MKPTQEDLSWQAVVAEQALRVLAEYVTLVAIADLFTVVEACAHFNEAVRRAAHST